MGKICCFAGHSELYDIENISQKLVAVVEELIKKGTDEFRVGNYGAFDRLSAGVVRKLKEKYPQIKLYLVIPYLTASIERNKQTYYNDYDSIIIADIPQNIPTKTQIIKCNEYMIRSADTLVCYVTRSFGGAARTLDYARKSKNVQIMNTAETIFW